MALELRDDRAGTNSKPTWLRAPALRGHRVVLQATDAGGGRYARAASTTGGRIEIWVDEGDRQAAARARRAGRRIRLTRRETPQRSWIKARREANGFDRCRDTALRQADPAPRSQPVVPRARAVPRDGRTRAVIQRRYGQRRGSSSSLPVVRRASRSSCAWRAPPSGYVRRPERPAGPPRPSRSTSPARASSSSRVCGVVVQRRPGQVQRAALAQARRVDRRHRRRSRCRRGRASRARRSASRLPSKVRADAVVDHRDSLAARQLPHPLGEALVADHLVRAGLACERRLLLARGRRDHAAAAELHDLRQQQPDAARRGVHEHVVARLHCVRVGREVVRGHALQQRRAGELGRDAVRHRHRARRRRTSTRSA